MTDFCTCEKSARRLYADKCLNCDKKIATRGVIDAEVIEEGCAPAFVEFAKAVTKSPTEKTPTSQLSGYHISRYGDGHAIFKCIGDPAVDVPLLTYCTLKGLKATPEAYCVSDETIKNLSVALIIRLTETHIEWERKTISVVVDEIMGILRRRRVVSGHAYWNRYTHVQIDFKSRGGDVRLFDNVIRGLIRANKVLARDGINLIRAAEED